MLRISWTARKSNDAVLKEAETERSLIKRICERQAKFLGHILRRGELEHLITTGMMEGKRSRGRQRGKMIDSLASWLMADKVTDIICVTRDRDIWKEMIAYAMKHGT